MISKNTPHFISLGKVGFSLLDFQTNPMVRNHSADILTSVLKIKHIIVYNLLLFINSYIPSKENSIIMKLSYVETKH
jgi:hypothetical protein